MSFKSRLAEIDSLQEIIHSYEVLPEEVLKKINYKFRLEWNYHSNKMEGGSLTRQETRTVMVGNITVDGKPIKDVMDMKGHDDVITNIIKIGKGELNISEKRIKEIHAGIIYEEDPEKKQQIGKWKTTPNYLFNYKGERFDFVSPADVPDRMHSLMNWLNTEKEKIARNDKEALHPVELAFRFHLDYIVIHPFFDGNGRTARIFTNLILIAYGYPPIYIKTEEKSIYYQYLADIQGYGGAPDLFLEFMAGLLLRSQQIVLGAIEGKSIDEPDDLDKRLFLLEKELEDLNLDDEVKVNLNQEVFWEIFDSWLLELIKEAVPVIQKFNKLFTGVEHHVYVTGRNGVSVNFVDEKAELIIDKIRLQLKAKENIINNHEIKISVRANYGTLKKGGLNTFGCHYNLEVVLQEIKYQVYVDKFNPDLRAQEMPFEKLLHHPLNKDEIKKVVYSLGDTIFNHIDFYSKKQGLR